MSLLQPNLLNTSTIPKLVLKDGWTGANAHIYLPFYSYGYWFASGQQLTFPRSQIPQDTSLVFSGTIKPNTFRKDCCSCL